MSKKTVNEYFNEADLALLSAIEDKAFVGRALNDYENSTGDFKDSKDPVGLLFSTILKYTIKNIFVRYDYGQLKHITTGDEAFNLMLQKIEEFHIPIEQYPALLVDAGICRDTTVLDKLLKYDFDIDQKISADGLYSAYTTASKLSFDWSIISKFIKHRQKRAVMKLEILDESYLNYLCGIEDYEEVIDIYFTSSKPPVTLIVQLFQVSLKNLGDKAKKEQSEKIFYELLDKVGHKIDLGKEVNILQDAIIAKDKVIVQKLLDTYQFNLLAYGDGHSNSCWNTASDWRFSECLELLKAYLKKRRLEKSQAIGLDLTDPQLAEFQVYIDRYFDLSPENDEATLSLPQNLQLLILQMYTLAIRAGNINVLRFLHTHIKHEKYKGTQFISTQLRDCSSDFLKSVVEMLDNAGENLSQAPELLSAVYSHYKINRNLDTFKYLKERGVDLNQTITYGYSQTTLADISKYSDITLYNLLTGKDKTTDASTITVPPSVFGGSFAEPPKASSTNLFGGFGLSHRGDNTSHDLEEDKEEIRRAQAERERRAKEDENKRAQEERARRAEEEIRRAHDAFRLSKLDNCKKNGIDLNVLTLNNYREFIEQNLNDTDQDHFALFNNLYIEVLSRKDIETLRFLHANIIPYKYRMHTWVLPELLKLQDPHNGKFLRDCIKLFFENKEINDANLLSLVYEFYLINNDLQALTWLFDNGFDITAFPMTYQALLARAQKDGKKEFADFISSKNKTALSENESEEDPKPPLPKDPNKGHSKKHDSEDKEEVVPAVNFFPIIKKPHWTAFGFMPKVKPPQIAAFVSQLDHNHAKLNLSDASENVQNAYANLVKYGAKLSFEASKIKEKDQSKKSSIALKSKITALNHFINIILSQSDLSSAKAIESIRNAYLHLERHDENRGTGLYIVHSMIKGLTFEDEDGNEQYVISKVGELAALFMQAIDEPVAVEEDEISELRV